MEDGFIVFDNVKKVYQSGEVQVTALHDVSFTIGRGEICVIVGESGAGKTTLLNILGGMDKLTEGRIAVDGCEISSYNKRDLTNYRRTDVGFVFQFYNLIPNLTALENIEIAAKLSSNALPPAQVLADVGLAERAGNFPAQLSGGEQQRVAIARALAKNPKLLLCDEPTGALNRANSNEVMDELTKINKEGTTIMMGTHDSKVAAKCSRVLYIVDGNIQGELKLPKIK